MWHVVSTAQGDLPTAVAASVQTGLLDEQPTPCHLEPDARDSQSKSRIRQADLPGA